ncbi:HNH endonuclease [Glaciihabitans tibetensis]|uniref:HNH endonuclease n=1 Tax=Glaciihabitans tibetensis TaxID=1266600 RepID=A0A2T0VEU2_9MICO|nr:HNH endonuclease signature motif containing protein [Glaciihabitans tibetensis]PRY68632.1 HNH endonuclease [Glaciihabitans tibetensis]
MTHLEEPSGESPTQHPPTQHPPTQHPPTQHPPTQYPPDDLPPDDLLLNYLLPDDLLPEDVQSEAEEEAQMAELRRQMIEYDRINGPVHIDLDRVPDDPHPQGWSMADWRAAWGEDPDPSSPQAMHLTRLAMVDEILALEAAEAELHAQRTRKLDAYRRACAEKVAVADARAETALIESACAKSESVEGESAPGGPGKPKPGWSDEVIARREMTTELAAALRKSENQIAMQVAEAAMLVGFLPNTLAALDRGQITYRHAAVIASLAAELPEEARAAFEQAVLPIAVEATVPRLTQRARVIRERMHPESIEDRNKKARQRQYLAVDPAADGMAVISAQLPAADAIGIYNRCTETAIRLQGPDEQRPLGQLKAAVFRDLLLNGEIPASSPARRAADGAEVLAGGAATGIRATVTVMVPALTLLGRSDEPATVEGYGPIDRDTAMELAAGAPSWMRVLTHPETGVVLSVGQDRYKVPAAMRSWLQLRDEICRAPGCARPAKFCDLDHIIEWQYGGHTSTDNLQHLCPTHHNVKSYTGWKVRALGNGMLEWVSPAKKVHITKPAVSIGFPKPEVDSSATVWSNLDAMTDPNFNPADHDWYRPQPEGPHPF